MTVDSSMPLPSSPRDDVLHKAFALLDHFKDSAEGQVYVPHIKELLLIFQQRYTDAEQVHQGVIHQIVTLLTPHIKKNPALRAKFNILKVHLQTPVSDTDMMFVRKFVNQLGDGLDTVPVDEHSLVHLFAPGASRATQAPESEVAISKAAHHRNEARERIQRENDANVVYRHQLTRKSHEIRKLRDDVARHVDETIAHNEQFGVLLEIELDALQHAVEMEAVEDRREVLIEEVEKFIKRHQVLTRKFESARNYLQRVDINSQQLTDEMDRVRLLSVTDELTGLPNRRAFMKRLEDEIGRVNRYRYPISLVLIDLDGFKSVNDQYGHAAGDAVLRAYAENVLCAFRHHDLVARYGGEEFAVILPNTSGEGTMRALAKVQEIVTTSQCSYNGSSISLPTFSAGLAEFRPGEQSSEYIERVDAALYQAKHSGRNRIVMAGSTPVAGERNSERA